MIRTILLKVSLSAVGLGAVLFLTKAWSRETDVKPQAPLASKTTARNHRERIK